MARLALLAVAIFALMPVVDALHLRQAPGIEPGTQLGNMVAPVIENAPATSGGASPNNDLVKIAEIFSKEPPSAGGAGGGGDDMEMFGGGIDPLAPCDEDDDGVPQAAGAAPAASGPGGKIKQQIDVLEDLIKRASTISGLIPAKQEKLSGLKAKYAAIESAAMKAAEEKKKELAAQALSDIDAQIAQLTAAKTKVESELGSAGGAAAAEAAPAEFLF